MKRETQTGYYNGEPIPAKRLIGNGRTCGFCNGPDHYGFCDPMREHNANAILRVAPLVNPKVRS